jgi:hypothetical protein
MNGFDYLRKASTMLSPRTPAAAYMAVEAGLLPDAAFVYKACAVRSLLEKPYNIDELERILAMKNMEYGTILLLMRILTELLDHPDSDTSLFAAEGINTIEGRYNEEVELLRALISIDPDPEYLRRLARQYWEIAGINDSKPSIRNFYLRESFSQLRRIAGGRPELREDGILMVRILLLLDLYGQARETLKYMNPDRSDSDLLFLEAEVEFKERNTLRVAEILMEIKNGEGDVSQDLYAAIRFWLSTGPGEEVSADAGLHSS